VHDALIVQQPTPVARQLVLLFHGVGASASDMLPLAQALASALPQARVVSVQAPHASDFGSGFQWFSVQGIDEANRLGRVAEALPRFVQTVRDWQHDSGLGAAATTLVGFSQGSIMALEAMQAVEPLAARIVAFAGRFASPPRAVPRETALHLIHGRDDRVIPSRQSIDAAAQLAALGARVTLDLVPGLGHGIDARALAVAMQRLQT
jgi:phospholipase/carboxylesterase